LSNCQFVIAIHILNSTILHNQINTNNKTMTYSSKTPINDIPLQTFIEQLSTLRAEDWQKRVTALRTLVNSIPDYSTTLVNEHGELLLTNNGLTTDNGGEVMWYRSPKMVRRLATPLKSLLLDARSAVVKEVTELIGILLVFCIISLFR